MRTHAAKLIGSMMQLAAEEMPKYFKLTGKQVYPILNTKNIFVRTGYVNVDFRVKQYLSE